MPGLLTEKFNVIDTYEKSKELKDFLYCITRVLFLEIEKEATKNDCEIKNLDLTEKCQVAEKILKIYEELEYNVNLRLALEETFISVQKF